MTMGKRGPAPRPTQLKQFYGEKRPSRIQPQPQPREALPEPPIDMTDDAREVWIYTIGELGPMRIATSADRDALAAYCEAVSMHRRATRLLAKSEILIKGQKGNVVRNPAVQMQRDAAQTMKAFAAEFGLTPRARAEFKTAEHGGDDDIQALLS
jgi:P27 family predicted phage terminase small subunit